MTDAARRLEAILAGIPYAQFLGIRAEIAGDEMTAILPYSDHLIGNPLLPALHGGVTGAFMELTAMAQLAVSERRVRPATRRALRILRRTGMMPSRHWSRPAE